MSARRAFSVAIWARHQGRILLIQHRRLKTWLPVGGELAPGETPLEAATRELREETGLSGAFADMHGVTGTPQGYLGYEEHDAGNKGLHMNWSFVVDVSSDRVVPNHEFSEHVWADAAALARLDCPVNVKELGRLALQPSVAAQRAVAERWLEAFNGRDLPRLLALYADDAVHTSPKKRVADPKSAGRIVGRAALEAWWMDAMERLPELYYKPLHITAGDGRVVMEYERQNPDEPAYVVAEVLVLGADGKIASSHVFHG